MRRLQWLGLAVILGACGGTVTLGDGQTGVGGGTGSGLGSAGGGGGGNVVSADGGFDGLPCEVAQVLANHCVSCHGPVLSGAAPFPLVSRADLLDVSAVDSTQNQAQRSLIRMQLGEMPPYPAAAPSAAELVSFQAWVTAGEPQGSCGAGVTPVDAGVVVPTCASNSFWPPNGEESRNMDPGQACRACHLSRAADKAYFFMGTVYASAHEEDLCDAEPPSAVRVDIIDANDAGVLTMKVLSTSGNFFSSNRAAIGTNGKNIALPYRARVVRADGGFTEMRTGQRNGDCNVCHTVIGVGVAPGRVVWPP